MLWRRLFDCAGVKTVFPIVSPLTWLSVICWPSVVAYWWRPGWYLTLMVLLLVLVTVLFVDSDPIVIVCDHYYYCYWFDLTVWQWWHCIIVCYCIELWPDWQLTVLVCVCVWLLLTVCVVAISNDETLPRMLCVCETLLCQAQLTSGWKPVLAVKLTVSNWHWHYCDVAVWNDFVQPGIEYWELCVDYCVWPVVCMWLTVTVTAWNWQQCGNWPYYYSCWRDCSSNTFPGSEAIVPWHWLTSNCVVLLLLTNIVNEDVCIGCVVLLCDYDGVCSSDVVAVVVAVCNTIVVMTVWHCIVLACVK